MMLKTDRFRVQYLEHLRELSKPTGLRKARTVGNQGVGLSFDSQTPIVWMMIERGWIQQVPGYRIAITMEGRAALSKMKKLFM